MPEAPQFHQKISAPEAQEEILTPEDRERLFSLCAEAIGYNSLLIGFRDQTSVALRQRLRNEDGKAVVYLLDVLGSLPTVAHYEAYTYLCLLNLCASNRDAQKIGALLARDDVALATDRSNKYKIFEILDRIGTQENIDQLVSCASKCFNAPYSVEMQRQDCVNIMEVFMAIGMHINEENANERIQNAAEHVKRIIYDHTGQEFTDLEGYAIVRDVYAEERYEDFPSLFEVEEPQESDNNSNPYNYEHDERNMSWEDEQDDQMEDAYQENRFVEIESRLEVIKRLHHEIKEEKNIKEEPEDDETKFLRRHWLEYREEHPSPYTPTLGIEIEIREKTVLPKEAENWDYPQTPSGFLENQKAKYRWTERLGVGRGRDAFWEFAHNPVRNYVTLSREVQALMDMGLINKEYRKHSLHITVGGVTSEGIGGEGAFVLARALESTGWGTTGGRIMRPYLLKRGAWTYKGQAGVKERDVSELKLETVKAIEIRTMQVQGLTGLDRLLKSCFLLGTALKAYQDRGLGFRLVSGVNPEIEEQLGFIWESFAEKTTGIFNTYGLTDPSIIWEVLDRFHEDGDDPKGDFVPFAMLLDEARTSPQSRGAEFVAEMRGLIITTRKQIADIVYRHVS